MFPLDHIRALVVGRDDPAEIEADAASQTVTASQGNPEFVVIETSGDTLNLRRWP